jgi:MoaA/NifB/PqqE/SkfB family radical SAM enzyme
MRLISHPILCNYYVTYRCNATCDFCDIWEKPSPYVTPEEVYQNLSDFKKLRGKVVDFTGGEPLLHRQLAELLKIAKQLKLITTVTTNGLLYPKRAEELRGLVDMLHFSLDSPNKEKHDKSRGVACFDKVMEGIQLAKSLGEKPDILFTIFEDNVHEIKEMYEKITQPNGLVLILNPVFSYNGINHQLPENVLRELSAWGQRSGVYLNEAFIQLRRDGGNHSTKPVCRAGSTTVVISPENKLVLPCYHLGLEQIPIEGQLFQLYQSQKIQELIALEGRLPACEGCVINCYFQPSFAAEVNKYFWKALPSTIKYNWMKGTWKQLI